MPSLEFKAFKASSSKVKVLVFHPTKPWLAFADRGQTVTVLDWKTQQVIHEAQVGSTEDSSALDAALQRLAEKDPGYYGSASAGASASVRTTAPGSVKDVCFLDLDTCFWQIAQLHALQYKSHSSAGIPHIGKARKLKGHRWLVIACETKILLQDLTSSIVVDIPRTMFDSRVPTCLAVLYLNSATLLAGANSEVEDLQKEASVSPIIAAGTATGVIYLLSIHTTHCFARLVGGHKAGVTKLVVIGGKDGRSPHRLVSGAADGSLAVWDPSAAPAGPAPKEISPASTTKVHDSEVLSMVLCSAPTDTPDTGALRLVTSGEDKRVVVLELPTLGRQIARWRPLAKGAVDCLAVSSSAVSSSGAASPLLAISGDRPAVWNLTADGRQQEGAVLLSLDNFLPVGTKKVAKVYTIAAHPLRPDVIAVGANAGVGLLTFDRSAAVPAAVLPGPASSAPDLESSRLASPASSSRGLEFLYATQSALWRLSYRVGWNIDNPGRELTAELSSKASVASLGLRGSIEVAVSPSGRHCSLVWPDIKEFAVYSSTGGDAWRQVQGGSGAAVAWASDGSHFAVLHLPQVRLPEVRRGKTKKSRAKEDEAAAQAAVQAAAMAAQEGGHVKIYSISGGGAVTEQKPASTNLGCERPSQLHGGPLLSITSSKSITRGQRRGHSMQFYSWMTGRPAGPELLAPCWLSWDPEVTAVALAYPDAVVLCRTRPSFAPIATLPIEAASSGMWQRRLLFLVSPTDVHAIFVATGLEIKDPFIETVKLASLEGGVVSQMAAAGDRTASLPAEGMRCAGPVAIGGIKEGILWLIGANGQPFMIPLSHAGLRARIAAAQGDVTSARATADQDLPKANHDELAIFIAAMMPQSGLEEALSLSGISLETELALSRRAGKFRRALRCLQALAAGADDAAAFKEFPEWNHHLSEATPLETAAYVKQPQQLQPIHQLIQRTRSDSQDPPQKDNPRRSVLAFIAADNMDEESSEEEENEEQAAAMIGVAQAPTEAIEWDAFLSAGEPPAGVHRDTTDGEATGDGDQQLALANGEQEGPAMPAQPRAEAEVSREEAQRIAELVGEGLLLVDTALGCGHEDVAIAALRTLLRGIACLPPDKLQALLVRCGQCNLMDEIRRFAKQIVTDGTGASPETAALAAALVDDSSLARSALQSSGMVALSAIFSHTWKSGNSLQDINDWGTFLTAAAGNGVQFAVSPPSLL